MSTSAESIVFANHKGGTGKTTSCLSIAGCLAKSGSKVLVVDLDPQANATSGLGIDVMTLTHSIYDIVLHYCDGYGGAPITQVILETGVENLHLAPAELDLSVAPVLMQHTEAKADILNRILEGVRPLYDYVLIDAPPGLGPLTINSLCASDQVVVPLEPSIFSLEALDNLKISIRDAKRMAGHSINRVTAVLTRYVKPNLLSRMYRRRNPSQEVETRLRERETVFTVPDSIQIYEAQREGIPISHYAPRSTVARAYAQIAKSMSLDANRNRSSTHHRRQLNG